MSALGRGNATARGAARRRRRAAAAGFTLVEVMVSMAIVATTVGALQIAAGEALKSTIETNRIRAAKMLLSRKTEEVLVALEQGATGGFEGFPGFSWEVFETLVAIEEGVEEQVRSVTVAVYYPTMVGTGFDDGFGFGQTEDGPGVVRVTVLVDPPEAKLEPPPQGGRQ